MIYQVADPRFASLIDRGVQLDKLAEGCLWAEGPAYFARDRMLIWSDIPNNRMLRHAEASGAVGVFRAPSNFSNGNTIDREGRLVTCEHGSRSVTRTEDDGAVTTLADRFEGKRFNSPNDCVVRSDGSIWFTDPTYGIDSNREGHQATSEIGACHVYRVDSASGEAKAAATDFVRPNGIAFSPDERRLYVVDTGATHVKGGPRHIRMFGVSEDGKLSGGGVFAVCDSGLFDGLRCDEAGRVWTSAGDGVHCYAPDGALLGKILLPEAAANLCFGGPGRDRLYITATTALYAIRVKVRGA